MLRRAGVLAAIVILAACDNSGIAIDTGHIVQPEIRQSENGLLSTRLEAGLALNPVVDASSGLRRDIETPTYEGRLLGPTLRLRPGDRLELELVNNLPPNPAQARQGAFPHEPYTTNIHTHGLTVSPQGNGDNAFRQMLPQTSNPFAVDIPAFHAPGTSWYHPHKHGSVAFQFFGGMAGMLIIEGGPGTIDAVPEISAAADIPMVFQAIRVGPDGRVPWLNTEATQYSRGGVYAHFADSDVYVLTNGESAPEHRMRPGEVQRWRLLNAASGVTLAVLLQGADFNVIANDGVNIERVVTVPAGQPLILAAGARADVLVKAPAKGNFELLAIDTKLVEYSVTTQGISPGIRSMHIGGDFPEIPYPVTLAKISVDGLPVDMSLPSGPLPAPTGVPRSADLLAAVPDATRRVAFESCGQSGNNSDPDNRLPSCGYYFEIYDADYWGGLPLNNLHMMRDDDDVSYEKHGLFSMDEPLFDDMRAGNVEEWTVINRTRSDHSFHIHQNPFLVTHVNGLPLPVPEWRDTILVPAATGGGSNLNEADYGTVTIRMRLHPDYPGRMLMHCHVVMHEDFGMMQMLEIIGDD